MFFKMTYVTRDLDLGNDEVTLHSADSTIELTWRKRTAGEKHYQSGDGVCVASCARKLSDRLEEEARNTGNLSIKKESVDEVHDEMYRFIARTLRLIRWRTNLSGGHDPIRLFLGFAWSLDSVDWKEVLDTVHLELSVDLVRLVRPDIRSSIEQLILEDQEEPFAHELLREAYSYRRESARSAIVFAVAAAEVGFKRFVAKMAPDTSWLIENIPSPPLVLMLKELLPNLRVVYRIQGTEPAVPASMLDGLKKAVLLRNQIVHGRAESIKNSTLNATLLLVRDFLYLLDFYAGTSWAADNVTPETIQALAGP